MVEGYEEHQEECQERDTIRMNVRKRKEKVGVHKKVAMISFVREVDTFMSLSKYSILGHYST